MGRGLWCACCTVLQGADELDWADTWLRADKMVADTWRICNPVRLCSQPFVLEPAQELLQQQSQQ